MGSTVEINGKSYRLIDVANESVWQYVCRIDGGYRVIQDIAYYSERYNKLVKMEAKDWSDGATYAKDIDSFYWLVHDELKKDKIFADGSSCGNWKASFVLYDILDQESRHFRKITNFLGVLVWGAVVR